MTQQEAAAALEHLDWIECSVEKAFGQDCDKRSFEIVRSFIQSAAHPETPADAQGREWVPVSNDDLCTIMSYTDQDKISINRFIGCLKACGCEIMRPAAPSQRTEGVT